MRNSFHDGEGPYSIGSKTFRKEFFTGRLSPKRLEEVRVDEGKRRSESTFVHFRQLFQEGGARAKSLDTTGKSWHTVPIRPEAGREAEFLYFPCLCPNMEERHDFRESKNVHFCHLHAKAWDLGRPETDTHSVINGEGKVFRLPLCPLTLKEATS